MSIVNPCCCINLRTGAKAVAAVDLLVALILLIIFLTDLVFTIEQNGVPSVNTAYVTSGVWTILIFFLAMNVGISGLLYTGARNYSIKRCKWWFYIQTVITSVAVLVLILILCFQVSFTLLVLDLIHVLYRLYTLWVVYLFIGELTYLDTLCCLNNNKKPGVGGTIFTTYSGPPRVPTPPQYIYPSGVESSAGIPSYQDHHSGYPFPHEDDWPVDRGHVVTRDLGSRQAHFNGTEDGLPAERPGGIDNPTYLP